MAMLTSPGLDLRALPRQLMVGVVRGYRLMLSPWLGSNCRFEPTCSRYALDALDRHGAAAGSYLAATRILRCHPWCDGGLDHVPAERPRLFRHLFPGATAPRPTSGPDDATRYLAQAAAPVDASAASASPLSITGPLS